MAASAKTLQRRVAKLEKERGEVQADMAKAEAAYRREHERLMTKERKLRERIDEASAKLAERRKEENARVEDEG